MVFGSKLEFPDLLYFLVVNFHSWFKYFLQVLCYGLSLPLSEAEAIKDCVNVYCEWLLALTKPNICVPKPVIEDPNNYARRMIQHLYNLFVPREDSCAYFHVFNDGCIHEFLLMLDTWFVQFNFSAPDQVQRQILYCHRVLRCLQKISHESTVMAEETWERLLMFLLSINDTLLAPPPMKS